MTRVPPNDGGAVEQYLRLGLRLGKHIDGLVDAYYGPAALRREVDAEATAEPGQLAAEARRLLSGLDSGLPLASSGSHRLETHGTALSAEASAASDPSRRHWLVGQVAGLLTTARKLDGQAIPYADEVEACYGVRPRRVDEGIFEEAHRKLDEVLPGSGSLTERRLEWVEREVVPRDKLLALVESLKEELRDLTNEAWGLPDGESVEFELVTGKPWSGFNYYLGDLKSKVAINVDLPVMKGGIAHLVAHESYPGHHTEHSRKEVGLVRERAFLEETIFLVGTPQCLLAEGLADLGLEILFGERPERKVAEHFKVVGIEYDPDRFAKVAEASEALGSVRSNAAFRLHEDGADPGTVVKEVARWGLLPEERAQKAVEFLTDPTWRAYITCYVEGLPLCRSFADGDPAKFGRLLSEQLLPSDLKAP